MPLPNPLSLSLALALSLSLSLALSLLCLPAAATAAAPVQGPTTPVTPATPRVLWKRFLYHNESGVYPAFFLNASVAAAAPSPSNASHPTPPTPAAHGLSDVIVGVAVTLPDPDFGAAGMMRLRGKDGKLQWAELSVPRFTATYAVDGGPVLSLDEQTAFVVVDFIAAVDTATGQQRWTWMEGAKYPGHLRLSRDGSVLYCNVGSPAGQSGYALALNATSGKVLWKTGTITPAFTASPAEVQGAVVFTREVPTSQELLAVDAATGKVVWTCPVVFLLTQGATPDGSVYVSMNAPSQASDLRLVVARDGAALDKVLWNLTLPGFPLELKFSPDSQWVYTTSEAGYLYRIEASTGRIDYKVMVSLSPRMSLDPTGSVLGLVSYYDGGYVMCDAATGAILAQGTDPYITEPGIFGVSVAVSAPEPSGRVRMVLNWAGFHKNATEPGGGEQYALSLCVEYVRPHWGRTMGP